VLAMARMARKLLRTEMGCSCATRSVYCTSTLILAVHYFSWKHTTNLSEERVKVTDTVAVCTTCSDIRNLCILTSRVYTLHIILAIKGRTASPGSSFNHYLEEFRANWLANQLTTFFIFLGWDEVRLSPLLRQPLFGLLYQPRIIDAHRVLFGMRIGKGKWITRRKPAVVPFFPP
jgi:hypothetical protein